MGHIIDKIPSAPESIEKNIDIPGHRDYLKTIRQAAKAIGKPVFEYASKLTLFFDFRAKLAPLNKRKRAAQERGSKARASNIIKLLQAIRDGKEEDVHVSGKKGFLITKILDKGTYQEVLNRIEQDAKLSEFVDNKLRYDYIHDTKEFTIRMPGALHEFLSEGISRGITRQLDKISEGPSKSAAELASGIRLGGSANIKFDSTTSKLQPDKSFKHSECRYPGLVIEISWSQRSIDLHKKAHKYLHESGASIRTVVGVDVGYRTKAPAELLIWHAKKDEAEQRPIISEIKQAFRDEEGQQIPTTELRLPLNNFACTNISKSFLDVNDEIVLSAAALCKYLAEAEEEQEREDRQEQERKDQEERGREAHEEQGRETQEQQEREDKVGKKIDAGRKPLTEIFQIGRGVNKPESEDRPDSDLHPLGAKRTRGRPRKATQQKQERAEEEAGPSVSPRKSKINRTINRFSARLKGEPAQFDGSELPPQRRPKD